MRTDIELTYTHDEVADLLRVIEPLIVLQRANAAAVARKRKWAASVKAMSIAEYKMRENELKKLSDRLHQARRISYGVAGK